MSLFAGLYDRTLKWSQHRRAPGILAGLSFAESSFFPIPPDVMLIPMSLTQPKRAWYFASLTTIASVLGGILGYLIGMFAFDLIQPALEQIGYMNKIQVVQTWFEEWGFWTVFIAGFTPIPYKLFTITAGFSAMAIVPFAIASFIGRGARFFLVAGLMVWGGERMEHMIRRYVDRISWVIILLVAVYFILRKVL
ncbi:MAG TPA: DedA family protein [Gammaproteobacteria bacterium]|nr:DedA family protein [Gammaproteobacteria bacterium]